MIEKIRAIFPGFLGHRSKKVDSEKYQLSETELALNSEYHRFSELPLLIVLQHITSPLKKIRNKTFDLKQEGLEELGVSIKEVQTDIETQASLIIHGVDFFKTHRIKHPTYGDFIDHLQEIHEYCETLEQT